MQVLIAEKQEGERVLDFEQRVLREMESVMRLEDVR